MRRAVAYLRVSTDDKGQRPERQRLEIEAVAPALELEVVAWVVDDGTSASKVPPFKREKFLEAVEVAKASGASVLVFETVERFSREGARRVAYYEVLLEESHGLSMVYANVDPSTDHGIAGAVLGAVRAETGAEWVRGHSVRVRSGMRLAEKVGTKSGRPIGRPVKALSPAELERAVELTLDGSGYRKVAAILNRDRIGTTATADAIKRRRIGAENVRVQVAAELERRRELEAAGGGA